MGIFFTSGEKKTRAGVYQDYTNAGTPQIAGATNGIAACTIQSDWGPLGVVQTFASAAAAKKVYGTGGTVHVIEETFNGGAVKVHVVRLGSGGTKGTFTLKDNTSAAGVDAVNVSAKYEGTRSLTYSVRTVLGNELNKELVIYENNVVVEKITFLAGPGEADKLVENGNANSKLFDFAKASGYSGDGILADVNGESVSAGTNPEINNESYSDAFVLLEPYVWNTICVDTNTVAVHTLLDAYMQRVYQGGKMAFCVVGEPVSVKFEDRMSHAKAFNHYNTVYVGGGWITSSDELIDGYRAAARISGMVAAIPSTQSLTHQPITGAVKVAESLTNDQYEQTIENGMLTFSTSSKDVVWIEAGVTTLVTLASEDDEGWKKIKRAKVRFELMTRASETVEPLGSKVNNDTDGRSSVLQALQGVLNAMVNEKKLLPGATAYLDPDNAPEGDSAWFMIDADDIDSLEKVYITYRFRFSPNS